MFTVVCYNTNGSSSCWEIDIDFKYIKYDIFEVNVNFPTGGTTIGIVAHYCEHHNMSYISQSTNKRPWNHALTDRNRTNVWILIIGIK